MLTRVHLLFKRVCPVCLAEARSLYDQEFGDYSVRHRNPLVAPQSTHRLEKTNLSGSRFKAPLIQVHVAFLFSSL